jgi:site-specific DNA-methyltransferase (cytosine-N4-specific)
MTDVSAVRSIARRQKAFFDRKHEGCEIICGDAASELTFLPDQHFQCCVTSPPYWGLRDYSVDGQLGAEDNLEDYLRRLVSVFREVRRTLKDDGTLWLNIGDAYTSGNRRWRASDRKNPARAMTFRPATPKGLKPKDLVGIPWRVAFALQQDGWFLRCDVVWNKPNCQPESVKDRPTKSHEYLFLLTKSVRYYYDSSAVQEPAEGKRFRNRRSVWNVNTEAYPGAHFATFPPALIEPCILSCTRRDDYVLDPFFGTGTVGLVSTRRERKFTGIELKPEYIELAEKRLGWVP